MVFGGRAKTQAFQVPYNTTQSFVFRSRQSRWNRTRSDKTWPVPVCLEQLRRFMGLATYYRKFIKGFSQLCAPLQRLTEKNVKFSWDKTCDDAFRTLKRKLTLNLTDPLFWIQTPVNPPLAASCRKRARMTNTLLRSEVAH